MTDAADVLITQQGACGLITLNRPKALNALNSAIVKAMDKALIAWAQDDNIKAVIVSASDDRAFCAGGDVKSVALEVKAARDTGQDIAAPLDFFRDEYRLNNRIYHFPKPYISLINGVVMGGGKGISAHGSHRVVTDNALFAMPETNIGFFPDVGGGYFLPRCPGQSGTYLALTSTRIKAADMIHIGFATHVVASDSIAAIRDSIINDPSQIDSILARHAATPVETSSLAPHRAEIDAAFAYDRIEDIVAALEKNNSTWAQETLAAMQAMSPSSLKIALRQIRLGAAMTFPDVMIMEYRLAKACLARPDFYEGVRAALIDKDRQPRWQPATITAVKDKEIEACFAPLGAQDLVL